MKTCSKCGQAKPLDDFYLNKNSKDGRKARCKTCLEDDKIISKRPARFNKKLSPEQEKRANAQAINRLVKQHPGEFLNYVAEERQALARRAA